MSWARTHSGRLRVGTVILLPLLALALIAAGLALVLTHRAAGEYFESGRARLHYTIEGRGEPVVLLHGFAVNGDINWRMPGIIRALARHYRVITLDLRGHGLSDKPHESSEYGLEMARDVPRLLDRLNIDRTHLVGYSLGGYITLKVAELYPERLLTATVIGTGWEAVSEERLTALLRLAGALDSGKAIGPLAAQTASGGRGPGLLHTTMVEVMTGLFNDKQALAAMIRGLPGLSVSAEALARLSVPLCIIIGSEDPLQPDAEGLSRRVPDSSYVLLPRADHITTAFRPEMLNALEDCLER
jgi:pimeloyl-ACP methyl ester carboxylesterase